MTDMMTSRACGVAAHKNLSSNQVAAFLLAPEHPYIRYMNTLYEKLECEKIQYPHKHERTTTL